MLFRRSPKHYERPSLRWTPPSTSELSAAQTLEEQMRQQLSSIASFNETERMVLLKQFQVQERWARAQAQRQHNPNSCPPSGLLSVDQFIAAWHNLSVKVCLLSERMSGFLRAWGSPMKSARNGHSQLWHVWPALHEATLRSGVGFKANVANV